jgi:ssDNA-binding Zn-finger/Zn-ribbon topoisomerase 1
LENTKTIRLLTCDNLPEAYSIKNRLNNEGIDCFLTNENFTSLMPNYFNILGSGIQIVVIESDYEKSRELVKDKIDPEIVEICPFCGSDRISLQLGKHKRLKIFYILLVMLAGIPIGYLKLQYCCKNCSKEII